MRTQHFSQRGISEPRSNDGRGPRTTPPREGLWTSKTAPEAVSPKRLDEAQSCATKLRRVWLQVGGLPDNPGACQ